jgi:hypothetical protein
MAKMTKQWIADIRWMKYISPPLSLFTDHSQNPVDTSHKQMDHHGYVSEEEEWCKM